MTSDQYTELVAFLGRRFEDGDRRAIALFEQSRAELKIVAEGLEARFDKMDGRIDTMEGRIDGRLGSLEGTVASLHEWVRRAVTDHEARIQALE